MHEALLLTGSSKLLTFAASPFTTISAPNSSDSVSNRSTWSQITQAWEDEALGVIQKAVEAAGLVVHSLMFDGLMVYHDPRIDLQKAMDAAAARIQKETGMELALEEKELFDQERTDALV